MTALLPRAYHREMAAVRRWSALGLVLVGPAAAALVSLLHPGPSGHWSGHLAAAAMSLGVAVALLVGTRLVRGRLPWPLLVTLGVIGVGLALEIIGNVRAAQSIWGTTYDDAEVGLYGPLYDGYEWGHSVAAWGDSVVLVGSLAFAILLGVSREVRVVVAVAGAVLALVPPWIYPALGPLLLIAWLRGSSAAHAPTTGREADDQRARNPGVPTPPG